MAGVAVRWRAGSADVDAGTGVPWRGPVLWACGLVAAAAVGAAGIAAVHGERHAVKPGRRAAGTSSIPAHEGAPVMRHGFEDGSARGWRGQGSAHAENTRALAASGSHSLLVSGVKEWGRGAQTGLRRPLVVGHWYDVRVKLRLADGFGPSHFVLSWGYESAPVRVTPDGWTQLTLHLRYDGTPTSALPGAAMAAGSERAQRFRVAPVSACTGEQRPPERFLVDDFTVRVSPVQRGTWPPPRNVSGCR